MNTVAIAGVVAAFAMLMGWWIGSRAAKAAGTRLSVERDALVADRARFQTQAEELRRSFDGQKTELEGLRGQCAALTTEAVRAQEQLAAGQAALASERELLDAAREKMTDTFKSLAGDILKENNAQFLGLANREFSAKEESIEKLLHPVRETLDKVEKQTQQLETKRAEAYTEVLTEIKNIQKTHETLRQETTQLVQALRAPKARGNWGELQLKRCIEFAGMVERCSFEVEKHMKGNDQDPAQRPDVVVQLPNGRCIVIDAKTPLDAYLSAMSAVDEMQRAFYLKTHAAQVRSHLSQLGGKQYWQRFDNSPDFVVCFLPSEVLFSAALEQDPSLIEVGSQLNVILATPTTLIALLKAVAYGWQQMEITRNAIEICKAGEDLYRKLAGTQEHFTRLGNALSGSVRHFNNLVGAVEGRGSVFSLAAKLHALKIGQGEIAEVAPVESAARVLQSEHWDDPVALAAAEETSEDRR
ncbi:MAG: DNA recombination protein RmuC [Acidobacteriaceae bacterium]